MQYLPDTNICIFFMKGLSGLDAKFRNAGPENWYISEITLADLKFGVENSIKQAENRATLTRFLTQVQILPIYDALDMYAVEKTRLRKSGWPVEDFDLLIGATAIVHDLILVTNNTAHFSRLESIRLEDWTKS